MAEELRFFLRTGLYSALAGTIYWFVSYEVAGSVLLAFAFVSALTFVIVMAVAVRGQHVSKEQARSIVARYLGFVEDDATSPLQLAGEPPAPASLWPLAAGTAATLAALGLVFGGWFLVPAAGLGLAALHGWLTGRG